MSCSDGYEDAVRSGATMDRQPAGGECRYTDSASWVVYAGSMSSRGRIFRAITGLQQSSVAYRTARRCYFALVHPSRSFRRSYSQFGEDQVLLGLLSGRNGRYVDVGSGHPRRGSNTYGLYRRGWSGTTVDPVARNQRMARFFRRRDTQLVALCGDQLGVAQFYEFEPYEYSTLSANRVVELADLGLTPVRVTDMPILTLASLKLMADPSEEYLLCIDVEGWELEVLRGNDWLRFRPAVICIEQWQSPLEGTSDVHEYLIGRSYQLIAYMGLSGIYVHSESGIG